MKRRTRGGWKKTVETEPWLWGRVAGKVGLSQCCIRMRRGSEQTSYQLHWVTVEAFWDAWQVFGVFLDFSQVSFYSKTWHRMHAFQNALQNHTIHSWQYCKITRNFKLFKHSYHQKTDSIAETRQTTHTVFSVSVWTCTKQIHKAQGFVQICWNSLSSCERIFEPKANLCLSLDFICKMYPRFSFCSLRTGGEEVATLQSVSFGLFYRDHNLFLALTK